ncbi:MAG: SAM-dependent methyltransferase [Eubacterium sp.]|nr:SAM-dependent methyltransferase [Eubacterium sp.]
MHNVKQLLEKNLNENTLRAVVSNRRSKQVSQKLVFRPFIEKNRLMFQREEYANNQVFHENMNKETAVEQICTFLEKDYKQLDLLCEQSSFSALVSKKGKSTIKENKNQIAKKIDLSHNRKKRYILDTDEVIPFLVDLGVQTKEGKIVDKKYKKYKQINRFLEFVKDVLPELPKDRPVKIIDFGCGKSYLTFAVYYYLHIMNGRDVEMIGLDLKKDVIAHCNRMAEKYEYTSLHFLEGDISTYDGADSADMVITLHACDVATDFALDKAVHWNAKVILSVPCCQHELNAQIENDMLEPLLKYGILKERFAALLTDALRANLLEQNGYEVQILEFIDMEHTPKNLLIRAIKRGEKADKKQEKLENSYKTLCDELNAHGTLEKLLKM